jgi:alpha-tubulin suppressor-like RCC1 family protein
MIALGFDHSVLVTAAGLAFGAGSNLQGQLGEPVGYYLLLGVTTPALNCARPQVQANKGKEVEFPVL